MTRKKRASTCHAEHSEASPAQEACICVTSVANRWGNADSLLELPGDYRYGPSHRLTTCFSFWTRSYRVLPFLRAIVL